MKIKNFIFIFSLVLVLVSAGMLFAVTPFEDPLLVGVGARPMGMGVAFVALADDANASFVNPAGLGKLSNIELTSMYGSLMGDVNYLVFGSVIPSDWGNFGINYLASNSAGIIKTILDGNGRPVANGTFSYDSNLFLLSYGKNVDNLFKGLSLGASLKFFNKGFSEVSAGSGVNADIGLLYQATDWLSLGLARQNTLGGSFKWGNGVENDSFMANNKLGVTVKPVNWPLLANLDLDWNSKAKLFHFGAEWQAFKTDNLAVALRAGIEQKLDANLRKSNDLTFGLGLAFNNFGFDYAYQTVYDVPEINTHYFSLSYKFAEKKETKKEVALPVIEKEEKVTTPVVVEEEKKPHPVITACQEKIKITVIRDQKEGGKKMKVFVKLPSEISVKKMEANLGPEKFSLVSAGEENGRQLWKAFYIIPEKLKNEQVQVSVHFQETEDVFKSVLL